MQSKLSRHRITRPSGMSVFKLLLAADWPLRFDEAAVPYLSVEA